jgi:hypothetical protein
VFHILFTGDLNRKYSIENTTNVAREYYINSKTSGLAAIEAN